MELLTDSLSHLFIILGYDDLINLSYTSREMHSQLVHLSKKQQLWYKRTEVLLEGSLQSRPSVDWTRVYKNLLGSKNSELTHSILSHLDSLLVLVEWRGEQSIDKIEHSAITSAAILEYLLTHKRYEGKSSSEKEKLALQSICSAVRSSTAEEVNKMIKVAAQNTNSLQSYRVRTVVYSITNKRLDMVIALTNEPEYLHILGHSTCLDAALVSNDRMIVTYVLQHQDLAEESLLKMIRTCVTLTLDTSLAVLLKRFQSSGFSLYKTDYSQVHTVILFACVAAGMTVSSGEWSLILLSAVDEGDAPRVELALKYVDTVEDPVLRMACRRRSVKVLGLLIQDERANPLHDLKTALCSTWLGMKEAGLLTVLSSRKVDVDELSADILEDIYCYLHLSEEDGMTLEEFISPSSQKSRIIRYLLLKEPTRDQLKEYMNTLCFDDEQERSRFLLCCELDD